MNLVELDRALRQLRLSGMAAVLETRLQHAQSSKLAPIDLVSTLVGDELQRRQDRLLERRHKLARFRDPARTLDTFDFDFNKKMNRALVYDLATARLSRNAKTCSCSVRPAPAKAISRKRSAEPRSNRATG
jgi:DNA replication protein DnaC